MCTSLHILKLVLLQTVYKAQAKRSKASLLRPHVCLASLENFHLHTWAHLRDSLVGLIMEVAYDETEQMPESAAIPLLRQRWQPGSIEQRRITTSIIRLPQTPSVRGAW